MNCDTAFEVMTDAEECQSAALAQHLRGCPRCRQMQEILSPALGYLVPGPCATAVHESAGERDEASGGGGRQPFLTLEALTVARDAASALAARTETWLDRRRSFAGRALRWAAVFAAGIVLGLVLVEHHDQTASQERISLGKECTRHVAARDESSRSEAEIQRLALSCAACHDRAVKPTDNRATWLDLNRSRQLDWLERLFDDERLVAVGWQPEPARAFNHVS
jgi:hypothetical protein